MIVELDPPSREAMSDEEYDVDRELAPVVPLPVRGSEPLPPPVVAEDMAPRAAKTFCPKCDSVMHPYYAKCPKCTGDKNRLQVERLAEVIRELKAGDLEPDRERELVKLLELYDHPAPKEFLSSLAESRANAPKQQRGRARR